MSGAREAPLSIFRLRDFTLFAASRFFSTASMTLLQAAVAWQVYEISGSALQLGILGLVRFGPSVVLTLIAGSFADTYDRRGIVLGSQLPPLVAATGLALASEADRAGLGLIYLLVLVIASGAAFENPARQALLPLLVPRERFMGAVTANAAMSQVGFVSGPTAGGLLIAGPGLGAAYATGAALVAGSFILLLFVRPRPPEGERRGVSVAAVKEGLQFVFHRQVLLGAMTLDLFAVVFGGATALLPIYASEVLEVGARGYGILAASAEAGAMLMALLLVFLPPIRNTGRALLLSVVGFGLATIVFGLSRSFPLTVGAYMAVGMADQISVVMRHTTVQLSTPDELRGRVSAVNTVFIGASNQLGSVESGFVAALTSATFAVVSGGLGCLAVVAAVAKWMPELRHYRAGTEVVEVPRAADAGVA